MTPKTKPDPKGSKKIVKKTTKTSSTLMAITKLGGGLKADSKGAGSKKIGAAEVEKSRKGTNRDIGTREGLVDKKDKVALVSASKGSTIVGSNLYDMVVDSKVTKKGDMSKDSGNMEVDQDQSEGKLGIEVEGEDMSEDSDDGEDIVVQSGELVQECEDHLRELEKELENADSDFKEVLVDKVYAAQRRLKDALLNLSIAKKIRDGKIGNNGGKDGMKSEDNVIVIDETEDEEADNGYKSINPVNSTMKESNKNGSERNIKDVSGKKEETKKQTVEKTIRWGDMNSDDEETIVLRNHSNKDIDGEKWEIVKNKKAEKQNKEQENVEGKKSNGDSNMIKNPYFKVVSKKSDVQQQRQVQGRGQTSLASFAEKVKGSNRVPNSKSVRINTSFTPRSTSAEEIKRVAKELLIYASEFDDKVMLMPWEDNDIHGPIILEDLANPRTMLDAIKLYMDKPTRSIWQAGVPVYGIGFRFSTNLSTMEFIDKWNIKKREYKLNNRSAYNITAAPTQKSPKSFIIGMAVGSTENQDLQLLNERLEKETGIKGIEASFQNINQYGVSTEFWKIANAKALKANKDKTTRDHLRTKFRWAPNAIAFYVPTREVESLARKVMLHKFGKAVEGIDPIWPDGSSMRFLPIKGAGIKNEKTREIVRKRMAYHIWLKANELTMETNFINIHDTIEAFQGKTFSDIILGLTNEADGSRYFTHFNRSWSPNAMNQKWDLSIKSHLYEEARRLMANVRDDLNEKYGEAIDNFFAKDTFTERAWIKALKTGQSQDDDENWFDDEDDYIDLMIEKGIVDSAFLQFLNKKGDDDDKQSVASWGTGETTYTELVNVQKANDTSTSSITNDSTLTLLEERESRITKVKELLKEKGIDEKEITTMCLSQEPYELAFSGIHLPTWDAEKEVFLLLAIWEQYKHINKNDDDK